MIKSTYNVVAVMSGTSLDGIDLIFATYGFDGVWRFKIKHSETVRYHKVWKQTLSQLICKSKGELQMIDQRYSDYLANVVLGFIEKYKLNAIDFVASHGHTALHQPEKGFTYQIGNQQIFANILKRKVICDFRVQDVEFGGQGAPLVPIGDRLLFGDYGYCLNLGGFANISFENNKGRIAFDICPVNIVLNYYVARLGFEFDKGGKVASQGTINKTLLKELNSLRFYEKEAPKSLGFEWVQEQVFPLIETLDITTKDILRTFVEHIAVQISKILDQPINNVLVTGGGAYNDFFIERLKTLSKSKIVIPSKDIIEFKEALVFGLLGILKARNEINCLASVTGAKQNHSAGKILFPNN